MKALLIATGFRAISIHYLYDPFVFRLSNDISDEKAKQDFYGYLINLFALEPITDQVKSGNVKKCDLRELFDRYFIVEQEKLEQCISLSDLDYDKNFIKQNDIKDSKDVAVRIFNVDGGSAVLPTIFLKENKLTEIFFHKRMRSFLQDIF